MSVLRLHASASAVTDSSCWPRKAGRVSSAGSHSAAPQGGSRVGQRAVPSGVNGVGFQSQGTALPWGQPAWRTRLTVTISFYVNSLNCEIITGHQDSPFLQVVGDSWEPGQQATARTANCFPLSRHSLCTSMHLPYQIRGLPHFLKKKRLQ